MLQQILLVLGKEMRVSMMFESACGCALSTELVQCLKTFQAVLVIHIDSTKHVLHCMIHIEISLYAYETTMLNSVLVLQLSTCRYQYSNMKIQVKNDHVL